jgi:hypothetical protein
MFAAHGAMAQEHGWSLMACEVQAIKRLKLQYQILIICSNKSLICEKFLIAGVRIGPMPGKEIHLRPRGPRP